MKSKKQQKQKKILQKQGQRPKLIPKDKKNKKMHNAEDVELQHPHKKPVEQSEQQYNDIDFNQQEQQQIVNVSFLIKEINDDHYHSLKTIIQRYSELVGISSSELANLIVEKKTLGNVSVADDQSDQDQSQQSQQQNSKEQQQQNNQLDQDDQNVCSVLTLFPPSNKITKTIQKSFLKSCQKYKKSNYPSIKKIVQENPCNVMMNQRAFNFPGFMAQQAHMVFKNDLAQLKVKDPKSYKQNIGKYIVVVSQIEKQNSSQDLDKLLYLKFQDEQFAKNSQIYWIGENAPKKTAKADFHKFFYLIKTQKYLQSIAKLEKYVAQ